MLVINLAECAQMTSGRRSSSSRFRLKLPSTVYQTILLFLVEKTMRPSSVVRAELGSKQGRYVRIEIFGRPDFFPRRWRWQAIFDRTMAAGQERLCAHVDADHTLNLPA